MRWPAASLNESPRWEISDWPRVFSISILAITAAYLAVGLLAFAGWRSTGNIRWVEEYFRLPGALAMVSLAAAQLLFSLRVKREFSRAQPMRKAWNLIVISAGCDFAGALITQILSTHTTLNPLSHTNAWSASMAVSVRQFGSLIGGPWRFAFLAAGLFQSLKVYRRSGFLARLAVIDYVLLAAIGGFVVREAADVVFAMMHGKHPSAAEYWVGQRIPYFGCSSPRACCSTDRSGRWGLDGSGDAGRP